MKKLFIVALALVALFASVIGVGCGNKGQTSETVVGKYYFYAMTDSEIDEQNKVNHGVLQKVGDEYFDGYNSQGWKLTKNSIVLEVYADSTFKASVIYGADNSLYVNEGIWLKEVDEKYENGYRLISNPGYDGYSPTIYLEGNSIVIYDSNSYGNGSGLFKYSDDIILRK